jgi:hypothetical protein
VRRLLHALGIDRPIAHTLIGHGSAVIAGPVTVLMIATQLSPEQQGYFYTFLSLTALNVFFELGLSYVVMQVAAHESATLTWSPAGTLAGDETPLARLAGFFAKATRWYAVAAAALVVVLLPLGFLFFGRGPAPSPDVTWRAPWVFAVAAVALNLCVSPLLAVLEGSGQVAHVTFVRAVGNIGKSVALWLALLAGLGLYGVFALNAVQFASAAGWLLARRRPFFADLRARARSAPDFDWRREVWPFQWKIALSWLSGYFLFQIFTPLLFKFEGPVRAGQMGMSINVTSAILTVGMAWIQTKGSPFGRLIATRRFQELDHLFFRAMRQSFAVVLLGQAAFGLAVYALRALHHPLAQRVLDPLPLTLLSATAVVNQVIFAQALYLRAHKQEPFLWPSVFGALATAGASYELGRRYGATGMMIGNFLLTLPGIVLSTWIFVTKRRLWHAEEEGPRRG